MITSFGVQYAGYIDMQQVGYDDMQQVGYDGTPVHDRWFPNERLIEVFANACDLAQLLERLGYDSLWTAEHHFQREGYECVPNVLLLNVYLASRTTRLKFGCGLNITPMWHPLRLAVTPGRGFCHGRYSHQRPGHLRRRPWLPHPRGGDLSRAHAGRRSQP